MKNEYEKMWQMDWEYDVVMAGFYEWVLSKAPKTPDIWREDIEKAEANWLA
ncbi:hypothetical protein [Methylovulum miyakonense]|uniref:hypothetical protein n=1 Tax=Methylovulum miyakonense TaxID=645578 RepID=UPI00036E8D44|nr:hypothetical protein [Methylovulum miyakonense]